MGFRPRVNAFPGEVKSLRLPVRETPTVPHDPLDQWVNVAKFGALPGDKKDDTAAIQKAIDSGATTLYFPRAGWMKNSNSAYDISDTIYIRGNVRRIIGLESNLEVAQSLSAQPEKPVFVFENGTHPVVVMERMRFTFERYPNPAIVHRADRDLVISAFSELDHPRHEGKGVLFLEDTVGPEIYVGPGSTLYARQLNIEGKDHKLINNGGTVWALGLKTEARSPIIKTLKGGKTEIIGGHLYKCVEQGVEKIAFEIEDGAQVSLAGVAEYVWDPKFATETLVEETRGGETRRLTKNELPAHGNSAVLPLFSNLREGASTATPGAPQVSLKEATAASLTLAFSTPGAAEPAEGGYLVRRGDAPTGRQRGFLRETRLTPDTEYTYHVAAFDRWGNRSPETPFTTRTPPDQEPPSTPENLNTLYLTDELVHLRWEGSKDEIGVAGYEMERLDSAGQSSGAKKQEKLEWIDRAVVKGMEYTYRVTALDAAGNRSVPAEKKVTVPAHPPKSIRQEAERFHEKHGSVQKGWFVFNLHGGCWMLYKELELGRERPFNQLKIRYGSTADRAGSRIKVLVNPEFDGDKVKGGTEIAMVVVENTGGWEKFQEFSLPAKVPKEGKYEVLLLIEQGEAKEGNALVNIDWFELGFAE
ncbi:MAG: carbohydrate-binding protein [Candidatus Competibacteraceae bacterium]|nr:carbohydrate-binding protein [Candidatus Competibacteraceae bacterium]